MLKARCPQQSSVLWKIMLSIIVVILLGCVSQARTKKPVAHDNVQDSINNVLDRLASKLVNKLLAPVTQVSPTVQHELDKTTLRKPGNAAVSAHRRPAASWNGPATSWKRGLPQQEVAQQSPPAAAAVAVAQELTKADAEAAAPPPVSLRGRDVSSIFRTHSVCGLECDFSGRSAWAGTYQASPLNAFSTPPKTSCEFEGECSNLPFEPSAVGTYSYQGSKPTTRSRSNINQDRGCVVYPFAGSPQQAFFAVYDGHGDGGEKVSEFAMRVVQDTLEKHPGLVGDEPAAFEAAFTDADRQLFALEKAYRKEHKNRGTTALAALMRGHQVWVANAGDSRCILASQSTGGSMQSKQSSAIRIQVKDLSKDQKPNSPGEQERIERSGGFVKVPESPGLPGRVFPPNQADKYPGLAVSRSIGDYAVKESGVIASPEVKVYDLSSDDLFMILASDGVWEFMSSQEAAEIVWDVLQSGGDATKATALLVENASLRWRKEEGSYRDDITAIVITLPAFKDGTAHSFMY